METVFTICDWPLLTRTGAVAIESEVVRRRAAMAGIGGGDNGGNEPRARVCIHSNFA